MIATDQSAAKIALTRGSSAAASSASPARPTLPIKTGDRYEGSYTCNQGQTALVIIIEEVIPNEDEDHTANVEAVFEFHFDGRGKAGHAPAEGSARMRGRYEPRERRLRLVGDEWIEQPANYRLITLAGTIKRDGTYSGSVEGPGCTSFTASPATTSGARAPDSP